MFVSGCECMISESSVCVAPGESFTLDCDPGGECIDHCSWDTPTGEALMVVTPSEALPRPLHLDWVRPRLS